MNIRPSAAIRQNYNEVAELYRGTQILFMLIGLWIAAGIIRG